MKHIYLDENISEHFATALNALEPRGGIEIEVHSTKTTPGLGRGASDQAIASFLHSNGGYLISGDADFRKIYALAHAVPGFQPKIFHYNKCGGHDHWKRVTVVFQNWEEIRQTVIDDDGGETFCYNLSVKGLMDRTKDLR